MGRRPVRGPGSGLRLRRARARPAAGRARARRVRGSRWQDRLRRRVSRAERHGRRGRPQHGSPGARRASGPAAGRARRVGRDGRDGAGACGGRSTGSWSTRPAAGSGRLATARSCCGRCRRTVLSRLARRRWRSPPPRPSSCARGGASSTPCARSRAPRPMRPATPSFAHRPDLRAIPTQGPDGVALRHRLWPHVHGSDGMFVAAFERGV